MPPHPLMMMMMMMMMMMTITIMMLMLMIVWGRDHSALMKRLRNALLPLAFIRNSRTRTIGQTGEFMQVRICSSEQDCGLNSKIWSRQNMHLEHDKMKITVMFVQNGLMQGRRIPEPVAVDCWACGRRIAGP